MDPGLPSGPPSSSVRRTPAEIRCRVIVLGKQHVRAHRDPERRAEETRPRLAPHVRRVEAVPSRLQLLTDYDNSTRVRAEREPSVLPPRATCAAFSLELALKCRISLDGREPPKSHDCAALFSKKYLAAEARGDIASGVRMTAGRVATIADIEDVLRQVVLRLEEEVRRDGRAWTSCGTPWMTAGRSGS